MVNTCFFNVESFDKEVALCRLEDEQSSGARVDIKEAANGLGAWCVVRGASVVDSQP